jgi:formimidoylglutamate deiminase
MATAHSHSFHRALRGRTQRHATGAASFWSWRGLMYDLASRLDPDDLYHITRLAYAELAMSGVTAVGEFHYVHHTAGGTPYDNRLALSESIIAAASDVGMRLTLIRTGYLRAGIGETLAPAQKRFIDPDVDTILGDVEALRSQTTADPLVSVSLAAHSVRAVPGEDILRLAAYAHNQEMHFHMHVAEQQQEVEMCLQEHGRRPVELLHDMGVLNPRFVAVHATRLTDEEVDMLGSAGALVCLCRTTEQDLGDGLALIGPLAGAGVRLCIGVDGYASSDAFEELRAVEMDERLRTCARHQVASGGDLLRLATEHSYTAINLAEAGAGDRVVLDANDASIAWADDEYLADTVIFGATPRAVREVTVNGRTIVRDGRHVNYEEIVQGYQATMRKLYG